MINAPLFTTGKAPREITPEIASRYARRFFRDELGRLETLDAYYNGRHRILGRKKEDGLSNNKLVIDHAAYIADFSAAFLLGSPVTYTSKDESDITALTDMLEAAGSSVQDADLALDAAIFGRAYDLAYMSSDESPKVKLARLSPLNAFVIYDETVEQNPAAGVYFYPVYAPDDSGRLEKYRCRLLTDSFLQDFELSPAGNLLSSGEPEEHFFGMVPLDEIYNNGQRTGDFEKVLSLIDAYDFLQSDRVNDKEQFVEALLVLKGAILGDNAEEKLETYRAMKRHGIIELPADGSELTYLTRQFDESSVEILKKSIAADIHKISCVPDMSDEHFAGNSSGVAMKYKLLGLEQLTKTKERYFAEGLKYRLRLFANILNVKGGGIIDPERINIQFTRSLPANEPEIAQTVATLQGIVPASKLLSLLPFIDDTDAALEELKKEKREAIKEQQEMMMNTPILSGGGYEGDEEE